MATFAQRFAASRLLDDVNGMSSFLGTDIECGRQVLIRTVSLDALSPAVRSGLEKQAHVLAGLDHPSLNVPTTIGSQDGCLYIVSPFLSGISLADRLEQGLLAVADAIDVGMAVLRALAIAHQRGVLHLDVKPANVMIDAGALRRRVTLTDFCRPPSRHLADPGGVLPVAAAHYLSPEQAGLLHQDVDERSDLYSAGALLFECLAGRPPFQGEAVGDVLRQLVGDRPPRLGSLRPEVPRALEQIVERLLQTQPQDRYQSAEAAVADLGETRRALETGLEQPVVGVHDHRRRSLTEPVLIGRAAELRALEEQLERASEEGRSIVTVEAESGGGKTRLLEEFDRRTASGRVLTLRGQGRDQTGQAPFDVLEGVVGAIVAHAGGDDAFAAHLRERLRGHEAALVAAMPRLGEVLSVGAASSAGLEEHGEHRTLRALTLLLDALGSEQRPALVVLDDCQWADEMTIRLLREWNAPQRPGASAARVLVLCAFRCEEVADDHPLRALRTSLQITLEPFAAEQVRLLVESMTGGVPEEVVDVVERLSGGSPFMATEVLRGLVETGALTARPSGWQVETEGWADVQSSRRAAAVFERRLERLPQDVLELLSVGAVLGKRFDLETARDLAGQSAEQVQAGLDEARSRRIVWLEDEDEQCAFVHDKLREALLARLSDEALAQLHREAALHIERHDRSRVFDIAYHFDEAGEPRRALEYALDGAESARRRYGLEVAERQYRIAERGADPQDGALGAQIAEGLADVAMLRGRYEEAAGHLQAARALIGGGLALARLEGKIGELAFKRGDMQPARDATVNALRLLGARVPRGAFEFFLSLLWEILVQAAHSLLPRLIRRRGLQPAADELLAMRLYSRLAHVFWFSAGKVPCGWTHLRGMNLGERFAPTLGLAQAYSEHAPVMTMLPWHARGLEYAGRSLTIRRDLGDVWGEGQSLHFTGVALYASTRYEEALDTLHSAITILERTGDQWEVNTAGWHVALTLYRLGRLSDAVDMARRVHRAATELGDDQASGIALGVWGKASGGGAPSEPREARTDDVHTLAELLQGRAARLLAEGSPAAAVQALREADAAVRAKGLRQEYVAPVLPWLATALRAELQSTSALAPARRRAIARQARRAARRAHRIARWYRNNLPHALRELGLLAALSGRPRRARRLLARSATVAELQGAVYELAQTRLALAELQLALGATGAQPALEQAWREIELARVGLDPDPHAERQAGGSTLSLVDRFSTLLVEGRRIALALTRDAALAAAREAAVTLLRCDCAVIELSEDGLGAARAGLAGDGAEPHDPIAVQRALAAGQPVTIEHSDRGEDGAGPHSHSTICAPIHVRGQAVACLYATHEHVGGLFGEQEERLAAFISSLAGAALENAEGFAVAERLSRSLERRVEERTAELTASQEEMRSTMSLLSATLESTADGILVVAGDGKIVSHNAKFAELWGIPDEILAADDDDRAIAFVLDQVADPDEFLAQVQRLYGMPDAESRDELEFKDGRVFERYSLPQRVDGQTIGRVWSFRDITAQKHIVRELQELDQIKSDFVSTVSHELRTPLTSITGYVEMLRDGDAGALSDAQDRMLEVVDFNTQRLLAQIEDLLTLSRIESGTFQLARDGMALEPIVRAVGEVVMPQAMAQSVALVLELPDDLPDLVGDASELDRALLNLATNAIKFTPPGGRVTISARREGESVRIAVTDTGVGIPIDEQDKLFTRFFRSSTTTKSAIQGTGLGLVIVKSIVDHHGGTIEVQSTPGSGTSVVVTLPTAAADRAPA